MSWRLRPSLRKCTLLAGLALACASQRSLRSVADAEARCAERADCSDLQLKSGVRLTAAEACWVNLLRQRCNVYDRCIVRCLLRGQSDVAGGCWQVCGHIFVNVRGTAYECPRIPIPGGEQCEGTAR